MEAYLLPKRRKLSLADRTTQSSSVSHIHDFDDQSNEQSTEFKVAILASLHPLVDQEYLLDLLVVSSGSINSVCQALAKPIEPVPSRTKSTANVPGHQTSLNMFRSHNENPLDSKSKKLKASTRKGQTLHLYAPEDIAVHTPCSIIHNFLPKDEAEVLLKELLEETPTFERQTFKLFDNVVESPHSMCFYVDSLEEQQRQKTEYLYNGSYISDVRQITPQMRKVSLKVQGAVNSEITKRIKHHYPDGKKLRYQSPNEWIPNAAFVNCYKGGGESVGYHSDQLTYLGPRATIGSLSLGVTREFRVRKIVARDEDEDDNNKATRQDSFRADAEGQIAIHLPHNSLLVMHADMQEEWKHSLHPASAIDPHPIAGNKRINVTYRYYRQSFHPKYTPRCRCNIATVLRCVQRKKENRGRYMWMCHAGNAPGKEGCTFFQWAEFDDDGEPPWVKEKQPP